MNSLLTLLVFGAVISEGRRFRDGPTVDPGVFVITHIRSCRNGAGYCILGLSCSVDQDFVKDDLGGNCEGLNSAFSPVARFICCRENPANFEETEADKQAAQLEAIILEHNTVKPETTEKPVTVTEMVTELITQTELVTKVEMVTEVFTEIVTEVIEQEEIQGNVWEGMDYDNDDDDDDDSEDIENEDLDYDPSTWNILNDQNENLFVEGGQHIYEDEGTGSIVDVALTTNENTEAVDSPTDGSEDDVREGTIVSGTGSLVEITMVSGAVSVGGDGPATLGVGSNFETNFGQEPGSVMEATIGTGGVISQGWGPLLTANNGGSNDDVTTGGWGPPETVNNDVLGDGAIAGGWGSPQTINNDVLDEVVVEGEWANNDMLDDGVVGGGWGPPQTIVNGESGDSVTGDVLKPGIVIDDNSLITSLMTNSSKISVHEDSFEQEGAPGVMLETFVASDAGSQLVFVPKEKATTPLAFTSPLTTTPPEINCYAAILLGIRCNIPGLDKQEKEEDRRPLISSDDIPRNVIDDDELKPTKPSETNNWKQVTEPSYKKINDHPTWSGDRIVTLKPKMEMEQDTESPFLAAVAHIPTVLDLLPAPIPVGMPPTQTTNVDIFPESNKAAVDDDEREIVKILNDNVKDDYEYIVLKEDFAPRGSVKKDSVSDDFVPLFYDGDGSTLSPEDIVPIKFSSPRKEPKKDDSEVFFRNFASATENVKEYHVGNDVLNQLYEEAQKLQIIANALEEAQNATEQKEIINAGIEDTITEVYLVLDSLKEPEPEIIPEPELDQDKDEMDDEENLTAEPIPENSTNETDTVDWEDYDKLDNVHNLINLTNDEPAPIQADAIDLSIPQSNAQQSQCGIKGGRSIQEAYGRAASKFMKDLVYSWVLGDSDKQQRDSFSDTQSRIVGGSVTSTMLYCWVAAIVTKGEKEFVCTGTLVTADLIVTSASCIDFLFKKGLSEFQAVLGDSNLNIDLPFGVQELSFEMAIVHENYDKHDDHHFHDIGLLTLRTPARLDQTVCLLCLPPPSRQYHANQNCSVTGYGRPGLLAKGRTDYWADTTTDGILREAQLPLRPGHVCQKLFEKVVTGEAAEVNMTNFICAGGRGDEEACYMAMDGGSPLACQVGDRYEMAGIVTFGSSCGQDRNPSIFTRIQNYSEWIRTNYLALNQGPL